MIFIDLFQPDTSKFHVIWFIYCKLSLLRKRSNHFISLKVNHFQQICEK